MAFDPKVLFEKIKNSKYGMPILIGATGIGAYVLLKGGIGGGSSSGFADNLSKAQSTIDEANKAAAGAASGGGGSGGGSYPTPDLAGQQAQFLSGVTDYLNQFGQQISEALGNQAAQTQSAIDSLASSQVSAASQQPGLSSPDYLPDFSQLYRGVQDSIAQMTAYQPSAPQLPINRQPALNSSLQKLAKTKVSARVPSGYQPSAPRTTIKTSIPATRGNLTPTYNSPLIKSRGGFGRSLVTPKTTIPASRGSITRTYNSPTIQSRGGFGGSKTIPAKPVKRK